MIPLTIEVKGEVLSSNIKEFRELVTDALSRINREPSTDEQFGQAELDVKALKEAQDRVVQAKEKALKDAEDLHLLFSELDGANEEIREARLELERHIKDRKAQIKQHLFVEFLNLIECDQHYRSRYRKQLEDSMKNKRTLDSIRSALDVMVTTINGSIRASRQRIQSFIEAHGSSLVQDAEELEHKPLDHVEVELRRRFDNFKAEHEAKQLREQAAKAKAEAEAAIAKAEAAAKPVTDLPEPPKVGTTPTACKRPGANEEWDQFEAEVFEAFAKVKAARAKLTHKRNQERATRFASETSKAWTSCTQPQPQLADQ